MASTTDIRKGLRLEIDKVPYRVIEHQFVKPGKGQAFTRAKIRNLLTGNVIERTWKSGESVEIADIEEHKMTYSWAEGDDLVFMDSATGDQINVGKDKIGDDVKWIAEGMDLNVTLYNGNPIGVELPPTVVLQITSSEPGIKGDTASGATKPATLSTGAVVNVPLFIKEGEWIKVDTDSGELPRAREQVVRHGERVGRSATRRACRSAARTCARACASRRAPRRHRRRSARSPSALRLEGRRRRRAWRPCCRTICRSTSSRCPMLRVLRAKPTRFSSPRSSANDTAHAASKSPLSPVLRTCGNKSARRPPSFARWSSVRLSVVVDLLGARRPRRRSRPDSSRTIAAKPGHQSVYPAPWRA